MLTQKKKKKIGDNINCHKYYVFSDNVNISPLKEDLVTILFVTNIILYSYKIFKIIFCDNNNYH